MELEKVPLMKMEIIIIKKPVNNRMADFPDKVSKANINKDKSVVLYRSPPKFPATDKKTTRLVNKPNTDIFFKRTLQ